MPERAQTGRNMQKDYSRPIPYFLPGGRAGAQDRPCGLQGGSERELEMVLSAVCYALGYLAGVGAFLWMARRRGLLTEGVLTLLAVGLVGGLVCANLAQWLVVGGP